MMDGRPLPFTYNLLVKSRGSDLAESGQLQLIVMRLLRLTSGATGVGTMFEYCHIYLLLLSISLRQLWVTMDGLSLPSTYHFLPEKGC